MSVASPALPARAERFWAAILAATLLNLPMGSLYAFSVLLKPLGSGRPTRSELSFVFGLASVGFTVGMNLAPLTCLGIAPAPVLVLVICAVVCTAGVALAATAEGASCGWRSATACCSAYSAAPPISSCSRAST